MIISVFDRGLKRRSFALPFLVVLVSAQLATCSYLGTEYAPGYSEKGFRELKVGDSKEYVIAVLGEPFEIVGHLSTYRYLEPQVNFEVDSRSGSVRVKHFWGGEEIPAYLSELNALQQLTAALGQPDSIIRSQGGQSRKPSELTYIYSREGVKWFSWNYRLVYISKETGLVTGKISMKIIE